MAFPVPTFAYPEPDIATYLVDDADYLVDVALEADHKASAVASHRPFGEPLGLAFPSSRPWAAPPPAPPASAGGTPGFGGPSRDDASSEGDEARWLSEARLAGPSDGDDSEEAFEEREETVELVGEEAQAGWDGREGAGWAEQGERAWERGVGGGGSEGEGEDDEDAFARISA